MVIRNLENDTYSWEDIKRIYKAELKTMYYYLDKHNINTSLFNNLKFQERIEALNC